MNPLFLRCAILLISVVVNCRLTSKAAAAGQCRADYWNLSSSNEGLQTKNPGVAPFGGYFNTVGNGVQTSTVHLQECSFGQPFSQWYPSDTYGRDILASVKSALYPDITSTTTRSSIQTSNRPFRYKWLLYGGTGTDVTAFDPTSIAGWFTAADRTAIDTQITVLKTAVAASPLDTSLRDALLDIYYDLAVAEMQAAKPKLAALARYRLGLEALSPAEFIIDKEITTYDEIVAAYDAALMQYSRLLTEPFPGIKPSSFDPSVSSDMPMGRYLFIREQPRRNTMPSQYVGTSPGASEVPALNAADAAVPRPEGSGLFTGYKDLNMVLELLGQRQQHLAASARLRGARQQPGDVARARAALDKALLHDATTIARLKSWFPSVFPSEPGQIPATYTFDRQSDTTGTITVRHAPGLPAVPANTRVLLTFRDGSLGTWKAGEYLVVTTIESGFTVPAEPIYLNSPFPPAQTIAANCEFQIIHDVGNYYTYAWDPDSTSTGIATITLSGTPPALAIHDRVILTFSGSLGTASVPREYSVATVTATGFTVRVNGTDLPAAQSTPASCTVQILPQSLLRESGLLASLSAIETGKIEMTSVLPFLNGSANMLGYDPDFLLLVQDGSNSSQPRESYDVLRALLTADNNAPLTVALNKLGTVVPPTGARGLYLNFQEKVDRVAADIEAADDGRDARFIEITGQPPDEFNPATSTPTSGSELGGVLATIEALNTQQTERKALTDQLTDLLREAVAGVKDSKAGDAVQALLIAEEKELALLAAGEKYKGSTRPLYSKMIDWEAGAAASQALYDTTTDTVGLAVDSASADVGKGLASGIGATVVAVVGAVNVGIQTAAAVHIGNAQQNIDYAGIDFTVATESVDATLAVNQARQELAAVKREQIANFMAQKADQSALNQATAVAAELRLELTRIIEQRDANVLAIQKKSYASPLHYHRAEAALIDADEAFREAQRWMFYTLQALNYKWHGKFSRTSGSKTYDAATVFKCRNARELDDLLTQMVAWNNDRVTQTTSSPRIYTRISLLDHVLARNPQRFDPIDPLDPGTRSDDTDPTVVNTPLAKEAYFQKVLEKRYKQPNGDLLIPFSTAFRNEAPDRVDGNFFRGATYANDAAGRCLDPGFWREKIEYVKVNIIATSVPPLVQGISGGLTYGGTTYFHTRVPPKSNGTFGGLNPDDHPGELMVAPFRYWVSPDFTQNFVAQSEHVVSLQIGYGQTSAFVGGTLPDNLATSYQVNAFAGRSIAATGWKLRIPRIQGGVTVVPGNIRDIELIIAYKHSDRVFPPN